MMKIKILFLALALSTFQSSATLYTGIVSNGDFEILSTSGVGFPPWQFSHGFDAFINEPTQAASGGNCVFIGGLSGGDMWQDLTTVVGQTYQFTFFERGDDPGQSLRYSLLNVFWGAQEVGSFTDSNKVLGWTSHTYDVTATSTTTTIDFQQASSAIGSYGYPGVDAVSVIPVPEPSAVSLFGLTLAAAVCGRFPWTSSKKRQGGR